jgi:hypothetical protein
VHDGLVEDLAHHPTAGVQVAALREGHEALGHGLQPLGLGLRGLDALVLEQLRGHLVQHQALVCGAASEAGALGGLGHCLLQ